MDTGTIPFGILDLLGRRVHELDGVWEPKPDPAGEGDDARHLYRARGQADDRRIEINVIVRTRGGRIWAVGVQCAPCLMRVGGEGDRHLLVAVPRPADVPEESVNWIALGPDGPYDLGVAA